MVGDVTVEWLVTSQNYGWWRHSRMVGDVTVLWLVTSQYYGWWRHSTMVGDVIVLWLVTSQYYGWWRHSTMVGDVTVLWLLFMTKHNNICCIYAVGNTVYMQWVTQYICSGSDKLCSKGRRQKKKKKKKVLWITRYAVDNTLTCSVGTI